MRKNCMFGVGMERRNDLCEVNIKSLEFDDKLIIFDEESFYYTVRSDIYIVYVGYLKGKASKRRKTILLVEFHPVILYEKNIFIYRNKDGSLAVSDMIKNDPDYIEMLQKFKDLFQQKYANVLAVKNIIEANGTFYFVLDYNKVMRSNLIPVDEVINADSMDSINIDDINSEEDFKKIYKEFDIRKRLYREDFMYVGLKIDFDTRERMRICLEKILELQIKINGKDSLDAATAYHELGEYFLLFEKDYDKAIENFEKVLEIRENQLPKGHEDTFFIMYELGLLYQHMGDKSKESEYANRALDIREELTGQNYRDGIRMDSFLMKCHFDNIRNKKETEYREAVIALHESMFDEESELLARMYYDASICSYSIDKEKSKEYAMKSLEIYEKINSEDHHMVTSIYFMINTYFGMDNIDFPNEFFQKESDVTEDWSEEDDEFIYALRKFMDLD